MRCARLPAVAVLALAPCLVPLAARAQGAPLDVADPTPRSVFVEVEDSSNLAVVGQSFGPAFPASWSVSGNTGTLTISAETHQQMLGNVGYPPVPESFTPIVIEIDRTSLEATSQVASGGFYDGTVSLFIVLQALDTTATGGFAGPTLPPLFCTSQQPIDQICQVLPIYCGDTCTLVPGSAYDPASGRINLIGIESHSGCDGPNLCSGPFDYFTGRGDLRLTEAAQVPALPAPALVVLFGLLAACARASAARRGPQVARSG